MTTRSERDRQKALQDKHQVVLAQLLKDEDNKYCVDCDAKGPRWASWNLGIFLCIRCAGIHRNLGVHISKVKSVNLDTWTSEQIAMMQEMGNSRARAVYEANIPDNYKRPQTDSGLEAFIRSKYEHKKYIAHEWVPPQPKAQREVPVVAEKTAVSKSKKSPLFEEMPKKEKKKSRPKQDGLHISTPPTSSASSKTQTITSKPNTDEPAATSRPRKAPAVDLLGLDEPPASSVPAGGSDSGDLFGEFMSTPVTVTSNTANPVGQPGSQLSSQAELLPPMLQNGDASSHPNPTVTQGNGVVENGEASLLGDSSAAGSDQKKSKESILALYGNSAPSQQQNMYGMAGGMNMYGGGGHQPQMDMSSHNQMYMQGMMPQQQQPQHQPQPQPSMQQPGMMNMQQPAMHHQYSNSAMYMDQPTEIQMAYTNYQQQGMPVWNANMQTQYAQGTGGMMGGVNTGMQPQNMMMSNQAMYNTSMYSQGQQMGQLQNQMSGMNLGGYQQQPPAMATAGGGGGVGGGMGWGVQQTGNTLATNLWQ